jgi:preprotein translocase subunit SecG
MKKRTQIIIIKLILIAILFTTLILFLQNIKPTDLIQQLILEGGGLIKLRFRRRHCRNNTIVGTITTVAAIMILVLIHDGKCRRKSRI